MCEMRIQKPETRNPSPKKLLVTGNWFLVSERGVVLISTFIVMVTLIAIAVAFMYMNSVQTLGVGAGIPDSKAIWLAEAGIQKAIWDLKTPTGSGGQGESWTTTGTTESLGSGSYTMVVTRWDFALSSNSSTASDSPAQTDSSVGPAKAIDGDDSTYWESKNKPSSGDPQDIIITFPYPLTLNKVRFLASASNPRPKDYTWAVSSDGSTYTTVVTATNNSSTDVTDTFTASSNVSYLRLRTTKIGGGSTGVRIETLEAIGAKITSTGTVGSTTRTLSQTVVADDASPQSQVAYNEIDWTES